MSCFASIEIVREQPSNKLIGKIATNCSKSLFYSSTYAKYVVDNGTCFHCKKAVQFSNLSHFQETADIRGKLYVASCDALMCTDNEQYKLTTLSIDNEYNIVFIEHPKLVHY